MVGWNLVGMDIIFTDIHNKIQLNGYSYIQIKGYFSDNTFNASVDVTGYEPVTLDEMINLRR